MTPFGKIYWKISVYHNRNEATFLEIESYDFEDTPFNYSFYADSPEFEFSNDNNTLWLRTISQDLYSDVTALGENWCWTEMFYTKQ